MPVDTFNRSSSQSSGHGDPELAEALSKTPLDQSRFTGCSSIKTYKILSKLGEGTFGEVHKGLSLVNGNIVALKKIIMHNEKDGFPITALREIKLLKLLSHPNILRLEEMSIERPKENRKKAIMYMVTPYMEHDLSGLLENPSVHFTEAHIKCYMLQLLEGTRYLHDNNILHRDMKAANLLINNKGILQIADFGLARHYDEDVPRPGKGNGVAEREYTTLVVTRWYRPPELLLQLRKYTPAIDIWGVGCVFGEMFTGRPILQGNSDLGQINMIFDLVGTPTEQNMPGWSSLPGCEGVKSFKERPNTLAQTFRNHGAGVISLLGELLNLDWRKRINAIDALKHPYFREHPLPAEPGEIPQFEESHELDTRRNRGHKAVPPPAPAGGSVGASLGRDGTSNHPLSQTTTGWPSETRSRIPEQARNESALNLQNRGNGGTGSTGLPRHRPAWQLATAGENRRSPRHVQAEIDRVVEQSRVSDSPLKNKPRSSNYDGQSRDREDQNSRFNNDHSTRGTNEGDHRNGVSTDRQPGGGSKDTYIPNYSNGRADNRGRDFRNDRDRHDHGGRPQGDRGDYAGNWRNGGGRSRSRSPNRDWNRDRGRDRSRDYRR
ncbi:MAG: serine/threonine protein kinase, CMGC, CDC2/CDK sub [Trizodia sp. TS-e1964]|nr:MAG: serine/threonine protein kinase, CMGC, CDC2/CDK sub [Trizodia sp. TS-e1964]